MSLRVHHLNCATLCPPQGRRVVHPSGKLVCHCLLIETAHGLVLCDTGLGLCNRADPAALGQSFLWAVGPVLRPAESAARQIEGLGLRPADVRHIVLTHLDTDHAGALADFPDAAVHVMAEEHQAATHPRTRFERNRYRSALWAHGPRWQLHHADAGEPWFGFASVRDLPGLPPEILMVPLFGHTRGHAAIAVQSQGGWLLHCGDAYLHGSEVGGPGRAPRGLALFERANVVERRPQRENLQRLRALRRDHGDQVRLLCAHDPDDLASLRGDR